VLVTGDREFVESQGATFVSRFTDAAAARRRLGRGGVRGGVVIVPFSS
jgi:hypothetical protein